MSNSYEMYQFEGSDGDVLDMIETPGLKDAIKIIREDNPETTQIPVQVFGLDLCNGGITGKVKIGTLVRLEDT